MESLAKGQNILYIRRSRNEPKLRSSGEAISTGYGDTGAVDQSSRTSVSFLPKDQNQ